jgi:integrase
MAIEKRVSRTGAVAYRVRLRVEGYPEVSATFGRMGEAREFEAQARLQMRAGQWGAHNEARRHSLAEAIDRYVALLPALRLKDERNRLRHARWWREKVGHVALAELTPARVSAVRDQLLLGQRGVNTERRSPATATRYLAALSAILTVAVDDWGWLQDNPVKRVRKPKEPAGRVRYLNSDELRVLLKECRASTSETLYPVVVLALATGMRKGEIQSLRWRQIDLERSLITLENTKNGKPRQLPLVGHAREIISTLRPGQPTPENYVFASRKPGCPVDISKAWSNAVRNSGLIDFRFHDLRHTAASYLAMRGASLLEIGHVLGHCSPQMTQRYAHLSTEHMRTVLTDMVNAVLPFNENQAVPLG